MRKVGSTLCCFSPWPLSDLWDIEMWVRVSGEMKPSCQLWFEVDQRGDQTVTPNCPPGILSFTPKLSYDQLVMWRNACGNKDAYVKDAYSKSTRYSRSSGLGRTQPLIFQEKLEVQILFFEIVQLLIHSNLKENFMWEEWNHVRAQLSLCIRLLILCRGRNQDTLLPTISMWVWLTVSKWLFIKNTNKCFIINWVPRACHSFESCHLRWLFVS